MQSRAYESAIWHVGTSIRLSLIDQYKDEETRESFLPRYSVQPLEVQRKPEAALLTTRSSRLGRGIATNGAEGNAEGEMNTFSQKNIRADRDTWSVNKIQKRLSLYFIFVTYLLVLSDT